MVYAGIDGGGTGSTLELRNERGEHLDRKQFGAFNLNSIGAEQFSRLLYEIFTEITQAGECGGICIGAAGISNPAVMQRINAVAGEFYLNNHLKLRGDHEIALYGATGGKAGCILIAGTGSICTGRNDSGQSARTGGWGHLIDDAGSGYALGRDALTAIVKSLDGRAGKTLLTEFIFSQLNVSDIGGLIAAVYEAADKSLIASLAVSVLRAGAAQDAAARQIIHQNAQALAQLVWAVSNCLDMKKMRLTLMGGLLIRETLLREAAIAQVKALLPELLIVEAEMDAADGAALLAME